MYVCVDPLSSDSSDSNESVPFATTKEKYLKGLKHRRKRSKNVSVGYIKGCGHSGFVARDFKAGGFMWEQYSRLVKMIGEISAIKNWILDVTALT